MLEDVEWGEFRVGDLLEKIKTKKLPFKADELPKKKIGEYTLPCLTSSFNNQGLNYFVPREGATILKNVISIPSNSDVYRAYFQSNEFTVLSDAYAIQWNVSDIELSPKQYLFVVQCINKVTDLYIYSYKNKLGGWNVVKNKCIQLPVKNGKINLNFMEDFIAELEAYLTVSGLNDYNLTQEEQQALDKFKDSHVSWGEFVVGDLFDIETPKKRFDANKVTILNFGKWPYIVRTGASNGQKGFINEDERYLNEGNTISFGQDTATMFYQNKPYFTGDKIKVFKPKDDQFGKGNHQFFIAAMIKSFSSFSWGSSSFSVDVLKKQKLNLPVINNYLIDFYFIERLISAIQKLVIKDVVQYADRKIALHRKVVKSDKEKV